MQSLTDHGSLKLDQEVETLEMEVRKFTNDLPYWGRLLGRKILSGETISNEDIDSTYSFLLEELQLKEETEKPAIALSYLTSNSGNYKPKLVLMKLEKVEGVNALAENQVIEFNPNITIVYGANGSGKSGYVRLFKDVFYSKSIEPILPNIHVINGSKAINASFQFQSDYGEIQYEYSQKDAAEFEQFSVFDNNTVLKHLTQKNEFEFRPSGLSFFSRYTDSLLRVEQKLNEDIAIRQSGYTAIDLASLFDQSSLIKTAVESLGAETNLNDLKKYTPFSDDDKRKLSEVKHQYEELFLASKNKETEIKNLDDINNLLTKNKAAIERLNTFFSTDTFTKLKTAILDALSKARTAREEGFESFKTDKIVGTGTNEWKNFIIAARSFASIQKTNEESYPIENDSCLFCRQPLSDEAQKLIANYWIFIKSVAEQDAKKAGELLDKAKGAYEQLNFDLFPSESILAKWLEDKYPKELAILQKQLAEQSSIRDEIVSNIQNRNIFEKTEFGVTCEYHAIIEAAIGVRIESLRNDEQTKELEKLLKEKIFLEHKEKFNLHFSKFDDYVDRQIWIKGANKANFKKAKTVATQAEKVLSEKYFNQKYIDIFNDECNKLNGNFGIEINRSASAGKSFRKLVLRGNDPNKILSEGEQKVIAVADFLSEIQLSEINRGVIFDDPVTSLDDGRKREIGVRLCEIAANKQVIIFTHDLVFVSILLNCCSDLKIDYRCHCIENLEVPGKIFLDNTPSHEAKYKTSAVARSYLKLAKDADPELRESFIKSGFSALRSSYEAFVIFELFCGAVKRFDDRVSIDSLKSLYFDENIVNEIMERFKLCCRYMEGHIHSDKFLSKKPQLVCLQEEADRFDKLKTKLNEMKKENGRK